VRRFTDKDKRSSTFLLLAVGINDLGRRRRKKREEGPALVDRAAQLVGVLLMLMLMLELELELELVLVLQIHKLAAGALGSIDMTLQKERRSRIEGWRPSVRPTEGTLFSVCI